MTRYSYDSLTLLCRLINRDNPDLKQTLSAKNIVLLGGPYTTGLGTSGRNTRIKINGRTGSGIVGKAELFYDRLNIGALFNGITVVFAADGQSATVADLLPALNEQYGLGLTFEDITNGATKLGTGYTATPVTLTIAATSVAFTGSLSVIWTRTPVGDFPDSGPGSKTMLVGSLDAGYFGKVSGSEMMDVKSIFTQLLSDDRTGTSVPSINPDLFWLKFAYKGKFLFFPSIGLGTSSWKSLYERGAVYGDGTTGTFPPSGSPLTKQNRILTFNSREGVVGFTPRLPEFNPADPSPAERNPDSEMGRLLWRVITGTYAVGDWDNLPTGGANLDVSSYFVWRNSREAADGTTEAAWVTSMNAAATGSVNKASAYAWRPFLELVELKNVAIPLEGVTYAVTGRLQSPVLSIDQTRDVKIPVRVTDIVSTYELPFPRPQMQPITIAPLKPITAVQGDTMVHRFGSYKVKVDAPKPITNVTNGSTLRAFGFTATTVKNELIDLATANGELDGFK